MGRLSLCSVYETMHFDMENLLADLDYAHTLHCLGNLRLAWLGYVCTACLNYDNQSDYVDIKALMDHIYRQCVN